MPQKRFRDSYFDEDEDYSSKRERPDRDTVESLLYRVGSKDTDKIQKDISELCLLVCAEISKNPDHYMKVFTSCAKNIPERTAIYTTLLGLINLKNHNFVSQTVVFIFRELKDALKSCRFDDAKYLIRFLSNSVNSSVVHPASILSLYENLAEVTLDVCSSSQARMDWYCYVVLYSLPYSAKLLSEHNTAALNALLSTINVYLSKRRVLHVPMLSAWDTNDPHPQEDYLTCLWAQICSMRAAGWKEQVLSRISDAFPVLRESGQPCKFPQLSAPDYDSEIVYPLPQVVFRMFDYTDVYEADESDDTTIPKIPNADISKVVVDTKKIEKTATLPGAHTIERFLVDDQLHIILETMHFNRIMCARALLGLTTRAHVALEYMIVEAIFAEIFHLPKPPIRHGKLLFYASLLIQLCNEATKTMPLVLAQAAETLFERLDSMKPVCTARFVEWFSYHLTNYQLQWSWKEWSHALGEPVMSPRRWFISETLRRLIRYSYHENVKQRLPRPFHCLLPSEPSPVNPYANAPLSKMKSFSSVMEALREKRDSDSMLNLVTRLASRSSKLAAGGMSDSDDDENASSAHSSRDSSSDSRSHIDDSDTEKSAQSDDEESTAGDNKRPHITARRRLAASSRQDENVAIDPLLRPGATDGRNASPPRLDGVCTNNSALLGDSGLSDGVHLCLIPGVTSLSLELFTTALLFRAHKTISHTCSLLKIYADVFRSLAATVESQVEVLHILQAVWINQSQMVVVISDYMCRNGLIDPEAVVRWAFSPYMTAFKGPLAPPQEVYIRPRILELHVWECLLHTLIRVGRRVSQINPKLEAAKESLELQRQKSASNSSDSDDEEDVSRKSRRKSDRHGSDTPPENEHSASASPSDPRRRRRHSPSAYETSDSRRISAMGANRRLAGVDRVARLEEERCEAVRSQCAVITLLLHRHVRLIDLIDESLHDLSNEDSVLPVGEPTLEDLNFISYWLKGRLMQTVLEHQDQLLPYMDNLEELMSDVNPFVREVFQALRSLYA